MGPIVKYYYLYKKDGFIGEYEPDTRIMEMALWAGNSVEYMTCKYLYHGGDSVKPLAKVRLFVPPGLNHPDTVRIGLLLFAGSLFRDCPSYEQAVKDLKDREKIWFHEFPQSFLDLMSESRQKDYLEEYELFEAELNWLREY